MKKITIAVLAIMFAVALKANTIFINEVDYLGNDQGLELVGPAGSSLDGLELVFYKLDGTIYKVEYLTGSLPALPGASTGAVWYDIAMIDTGSSSSAQGGGVSLVSRTGSVLQFISFGLNNIVVQAVEGAAAGLLSQFVGTQLFSLNSLSLFGSEALPGLSTSGSLNHGQVPGGRLSWLPETNETTSVRTLEAYPNPVKRGGQLQLRSPLLEESGARIQLYSLNGQLVREEVVADSYGVYGIATDLNTGMYLVRIAKGDKQETSRIVVE